MGCDLSRMSVCYWRTKPARKRLSSGDSYFRQNGEWLEFANKSDKNEGNQSTVARRLKKMFSKKRSEQHEPKLPEYATLPPSFDDAAETAVRSRNVDLLLKLIHQSGDGFMVLPSSSVLKRNNPVELACALGFYDILEVLLENGCSPNLPTSAGKLLHSVLDSLKSNEKSIAAGRRVVNIMINNGCDLDIKDRNGLTPLLHCAQIGDSDIMRAVLSRCSTKQLTFRCSSNLYTPLHMSAMRGDFECVKLLVSHSPHIHVNLKDSQNNTALHLALKSMLHNISYLNDAKQSMVSDTAQHLALKSMLHNIAHQSDASQNLVSDKEIELRTKRATTCERLMRFQQNAVAIVETLLMAGADVHATCRHPSEWNSDEEYYPLMYAFRLCAMDLTQGFDLDRNQFSSTMTLVSQQTIQSLEKLGKADAASAAYAPLSIPEEHCRFSPYAGVVRLLVLAGSVISKRRRASLYERYSNVLQPLLNEVCAFWDKYQVSKPPKLVHLAKLRVRAHLAEVHRLHEINGLPLPPRMKDYLKLNYL